MASSSTEICNLALSHIGIGKEIADLETEASQEASSCRRFYENARDQVLRDFSWPFAMTTVSLSLVSENPTSEWDYAYRYPTDCMKSRRILSGTRNETRQTRIPYQIAYDSTGKLIYTDEQNAVLEYTKKVVDTGQFSADFAMALSFRIAFYVSPRLTSGDPFKLGERALKMYQAEIMRAQATAINELQDEEVPDSEFIRERL